MRVQPRNAVAENRGCSASVLYVGQAVGSAIGELLYARDLLQATGSVGAGFVALDLMMVLVTRPKSA